jgi:hypothetical protein
MTDDHDDRDSTAATAANGTGTPTGPAEDRSYSRSERSLAANRRIVMFVGVLVAALGIPAIVAPYVTGVTISLLLGGLLVVGALVHIAGPSPSGGGTAPCSA